MKNACNIEDNTDLKALIEAIKADDLKKQTENAEAAKSKATSSYSNYQKSKLIKSISVKTYNKPEKEIMDFFVKIISGTKHTSFTVMYTIQELNEVINNHTQMIDAAKNNPHFKGLRFLQSKYKLINDKLNLCSKKNKEIDRFIKINKEGIDKGWELSKLEPPLLSTNIWAKDKFIDSVFMPSAGSFLVMINKMEGFMQVPNLAKLVSKNFFHIHGICKDWSNSVFKALAFMDIYSDIHINQDIFSKIIDGVKIKLHDAPVIKGDEALVLVPSEEDKTDTGLSGEDGSTIGDGIAD